MFYYLALGCDKKNSEQLPSHDIAVRKRHVPIREDLFAFCRSKWNISSAGTAALKPQCRQNYMFLSSQVLITAVAMCFLTKPVSSQLILVQFEIIILANIALVAIKLSIDFLGPQRMNL